jgi:DNA-binding CsgD family transcriptional regulator
VFTETEQVLQRRPDTGALAEEARELRERLAATSSPAGRWAMSLTGAELRLLPYLATHLTFLEIASRLFITPNMVKTEAIPIYRKLGTSSLGGTIERAVEVGLLESTIYPPRASLTPAEAAPGRRRSRDQSRSRIPGLARTAQAVNRAARPPCPPDRRRQC